MSTDRFVVEVAERLDRLVAAQPSVGSRSRAKAAIEGGKVFVDDALITEAGLPVAGGAVVEIRWNRPGTGADRRKGREGLAEANLTILLDDPDVIAVDKPPGLLTDTASEEQHRTRDSVYKRLRAWLRPRGDRAFTVHRIDRDTSGVVLFARNEHAEDGLRRQFRARLPERVYRALVAGRPDWESTVWRDQTRWHKGRRILEIVSENTPGSQETVSHVRVVRRMGQVTEIEIRLETGRRNQIRLQAASRGLPLLGERLYNDGPVRPTAPRQMLHALRLGVRHPRTGDPVVVECPFPDDWKALLRSLE